MTYPLGFNAYGSTDSRRLAAQRAPWQDTKENPYLFAQNPYLSMESVQQVGSLPVQPHSMEYPSTTSGQLQSNTSGAARQRRSGKGPLLVTHVGPCMARGGAEQHLKDLKKFLDTTRVRITKCVVTEKNLFNPDVAADLSIPVELGREDSVRRAARESDIILFWGVALDPWLKDCRPPLCVYLAHGESDWTRHVLERSTQVTDHVVAVSHRVHERVCPGFRTTVISNGVDSARLGRTRSRQEMRQSLGFEDNDFVLGYVGRFSFEKRPKLLIETVANLPRRFKALFVGWGDMRQELMELANARIPGRCVFASAHDYLGNFYHAMDAFCLLSEHEGFALVLLEAMLCGRPVIATDVGGVPQIIKDRINGLVVRHDVNVVSDAALQLAAHPHWARGIAEEGRTYAMEHGHASRMAREYEDLFEQLWRQKQAAV